MLPHPGCVPHQLVVSFERGVPRRLVRQSHGGDPARERCVPGDTHRHVGLRVVALVPDEGVEPLGRGRCENRKQIVGCLDIAARDAAPDGLPVRRVDRLRVADADVRHDSA